MKYISKIILSIGLVLVSSCMSDEDSDFQAAKPVVSNTGNTSFSLTEGDGNSMTVTLSVSQAIAQPILLSLIPTDMNGDLKGSDYELVDNITDWATVFSNPNFFTGMTTEDVHTGGPEGKVVIIPPYTTSYTFEITATGDTETEAWESGALTLAAYASRMALVDNDAIQYDMDITNVESLVMDFSWDNGPVNLFGTDYEVCDYTDVDVYMATATGFDINNPWANEIGLYDAATGDCPEQIVLTEGQLADGDYVLFTDLWTNDFAGYGATTSFAMNATFTKGSVYSETVVQDPSQAYNANTNAGAFNGVVAKLTIAGDIFTVSDYNDVVIASGLMNNTNSIRPTHITSMKEAQ